MGGIDYKGGCVVAKVNGGYSNGGVTIRIRAGQEKHLNGKQALALARVRKNDCSPSENDLTRARRQQKILAAMKGRVFGIHGFIAPAVDRLADPAHVPHRHERPDAAGRLRRTSRCAARRTRVVLGTISGEVPEELRQAPVEKFLDG